MEKSQIEIIRKYLANRLTLQEKQQFQQQLNDNPALAEEVAEYAAVFAAIQREGDRLLQDEFHRMAGQLLLEDIPVMQPSLAADKSKMHRLFSYPQLLALAAAVAGLLIVAFLVLRPKATGPAPFSEPSDLYATHFSALPANNLRGGDDQPWLPAYSNGDYQTAVRLIDSALTVPNVSAPSEKYLYLGIALLAQGQPEAALNALDKVSRNSFDWPSAQWYKALALLKLNRPENARPILERIAADRKDPQREQAGKILEALHQSR